MQNSILNTSLVIRSIGNNWQKYRRIGKTRIEKQLFPEKVLERNDKHNESELHALTTSIEEYLFQKSHHYPDDDIIYKNSIRQIEEIMKRWPFLRDELRDGRREPDWFSAFVLSKVTAENHNIGEAPPTPKKIKKYCHS